MNRFQTSLIASPLLLEPTWGKQALPLLENLLSKKSSPEEAEPLAEPFCLLPGDVAAASKIQFSASSGQLTSGSVAVMEIVGPIWKYGTYWAYGSVDYVSQLQNLLATPEIGAIVIIVDSPGGQASGIADLYDVIAQAEKTILVYIRGLAASAGYYAIAGADEIWSSQGSDMIGSIGVYTTLLDFSGFYAQMGIKVIEIYSRLSPQKNIESRAALSGDQGPMLDMLDGLVTYFHNAVKTSRPDLKVDLSDPTEGGLYFADNALELGLIDQIGSFRQLLARAFDLATNSNSNSPMALLDKHPKLTALKGVAAADVTDEQLEAVNENLTSMGIEGVVVLRTTDVETLEANETALATATTKITSLEGQLTTANAEVARLGKQPGTKPTAVASPQETTETDTEVMVSDTDQALAKIKQGLK